MTDITKQINSVINSSFFGLEIETCFKIIDNPNVDDPEKQLLEYYYILSKCSEGRFNIAVNVNSNFRPGVYDHWLLMPDDSLSCSVQDQTENCVSKNESLSVDFCRQYNFYPIEIITPKLSAKDGFNNVKEIWNRCIMSDRFIYTVNDTQGLHVNISHPQMNISRFVKWWLLLEEEIISHLPEYRQESIMDFAVPLGMMGDRVEELIRDKYGALSTRNPDRIEIRLFQGTMNLDEIQAWTFFCLYLLAVSIVIDPPTKITLEQVYKYIPIDKFWGK